MALDLAAELVAALRSPNGRDALAEAFRPVLAEEVRKALAERAESLEALNLILGCSLRAASARLRRDPELRRLGVQVGRRVLFRRHLVEAYYAQAAADARGLRVVG